MTTAKPIKHELVNNDTVFTGSALDIVEEMRRQAYFERGIELDAYLGHLVDLILRIGGVEITLEGTTLEERAESFIEGLIESRYFKEA